ncbi:hypothetical protein ABFY09_01800 [Marinomonas sp. 5E14-1]|uniref:hypothetical protein n=1 Tax=Marinomonas sp. 5E14-1 TaxID=3153922 RepID=UPI003263D508
MSHDYADYLTQFARPYVYTTSISPAIACATLASLKIIQSMKSKRDEISWLAIFNISAKECRLF